MKLIQLFFGFSFLMMLCGCVSRVSSYNYYMEHPNQLQKAYLRCKEGVNQNENECEVVRQAARDFLELVKERSDDPEAFGLRIINMQIALAKDKKTDPSLYHKDLQQLRVLYAVVSATTME